MLSAGHKDLCGFTVDGEACVGGDCLQDERRLLLQHTSYREWSCSADCSVLLTPALDKTQVVHQLLLWVLKRKGEKIALYYIRWRGVWVSGVKGELLTPSNLWTYRTLSLDTSNSEYTHFLKMNDCSCKLFSSFLVHAVRDVRGRCSSPQKGHLQGLFFFLPEVFSSA